MTRFGAFAQFTGLTWTSTGPRFPLRCRSAAGVLARWDSGCAGGWTGSGYDRATRGVSLGMTRPAKFWQPIVHTAWWLGVPVGIVGWLLAPRESVIYVSHHPFSIEANTLRTTVHPILGELLAGYRVTAVALILLIVVCTVSHVRRTGAVRVASLLLPMHVAAIEACLHFGSFGRRHHFTSPPSLAELRRQFVSGATASVIAVAIALLAAMVLLRFCRGGIAGGISWRTASAVPPLVSIALLWSAAHAIFFQ